MTLLDSIKQSLFPKRQLQPVLPEARHRFPYSEDKAVRREQIWDNLQEGILLENKGFFIPWATPYSLLDRIAEQRRDQGDRTNWYLGNCTLFDGKNSHVEVLKWLYEKPSDSFAMIREFLGTEEEGYGKFKDWKAKLTDVLGEPGRLELEPFGTLEIGSIEWTFGKASVTLVGIEQFVGKYWLYAGLKK